MTALHQSILRFPPHRQRPFVAWVSIVCLLLSILGASALAQVVATPVFVPDTGDAAVSFQVNVSCATSGAIIHFTTDGTDPNETSTPVMGPIAIGRSLTLKARAYADGMTPSAITSANYRVTGAIEAGSYHVLALKSNGKLWSWGAQGSGRLGNGSTASGNIVSPTTVRRGVGQDVTDAVEVAGGHVFSLMVDSANKVWAFGGNSSGQIGDNTTIDRAYARRVLKNNVTYDNAVETDFLNDIRSISAGNVHGLAADWTTGKVWSWGQRSLGRLGADGYVSSTSSLRKYADPLKKVKTTAVGNPELDGIVQVAAGQAFSLALGQLDAQGRGKVWAWGDNSSGQLGQYNTTNLGYAAPVLRFVIPGATFTPVDDAIQIAAGYDHAMVIRLGNDGSQKVWCWGQQANGRLGNGLTTSYSSSYVNITPVQKVGSGDLGGTGANAIVQIAAGPRHSVALDAGGRVWTWGYNQDYNLGDGTNTQRAYADTVKVSAGVELTNIVAIGAGGYDDGAGTVNSYTLAIKDDGTIYAWGYNGHGEAATGATGNGPHYATASPFSIKLSNQAPGSSLSVSPSSGTFIQPITFTLTATASDSDGSVSSVDFLQNGLLLGTKTAQPWSWSVSDVLAGTHLFTARVWDDVGASTLSSEVSRTVILPTVSISATTPTLPENSGTPGTFTVTRGAGSPTSTTLVVSYVVSGTATADVDYDTLSGTMTIPSGSMSATVPVTPVADSVYDPSETIVLTLVASAGAYDVGTPGAATMTLSDGAPVTAGLQVHYKAHTGVTKDFSNLVGTWQDQSGLARHVSQGTGANKPQWFDNVVNGLPVIRFDGASDYLQSASFNLFGASSDFTAFLVTKPGATQVQHADIIDYDHDTTGWVIQQDNNNVNHFATAGHPAGIVFLGSGQWRLLSVVKSGANQHGYLDGVSMTASDTASADLSGPRILAIGNKEQTTTPYPRPYNGDIAEIVVFDRALTGSERRAWQDYFDNKYLIPLMDADQDGLNNADEALLGSNPLNPDTNGDGLSDGAAVAVGLSATSLDVDGDSLSNAQELALGTDPFDPDTDHDGVNDNLDPLPLDPTVTGGTPGDTTPPVITLINPPLGLL